MEFVRSAVYLLFLSISVVVYSVPMVVASPFVSRHAIAGIARAWARANLAALRLICKLGFRIEGVENLPSEPSVALCKHQSAWETIALRAILPLEQTWVLKRELLSIPLFGWALALLRPIAIDRSAGRQAVKELLRKGRDALAEGKWVIVFPEGTRVAPGERRPYAIGGALLGARSGVPVVPIAHNAGNFWGRRSLVKHAGTIVLVIGPPISSSGMSPSDINSQAELWIEQTVASLPTATAAERTGSSA